VNTGVVSGLVSFVNSSALWIRVQPPDTIPASSTAARMIACVCRMKTPPYSTGFRTTLPAGNAVSQAMEHCIMA
jgi:hypothetical protein